MSETSKVKVIKIDDVEYVRVDEVRPVVTGNVVIAVLQRGWVMVGVLSQEGDMCTLDNAACVRIWGTTKGIGEIAYNGPTSKTILDKCPQTKFHILTSIMIIQCNTPKWESYLRG